ncbi:MAG: hypothetical protein ACRCXZ_08515 [Patescibacteria group bacterium]
MSNLASASLLSQSTKLNKQSGRQVYIPKSISSKVIKVEEHRSILDYAGFLPGLEDVRETFLTSSDLFKSKIKGYEIFFLGAQVEDTLVDGIPSFVYYEEYQPQIYSKQKQYIDICSPSIHSISSPVEWYLSLLDLDEDEQYYQICSDLDSFGLHKALEIFEKVYLNFELSGLIIEFIRVYREYFNQTGLFLDLTGHHNVVAKIDEVGASLFVTNSATKPYFSYSNLKKCKKSGVKLRGIELNFLDSAIWCNLLAIACLETPVFGSDVLDIV